MAARDEIALTFPPSLVDAIAGRVVEMLEQQGALSAGVTSPYLDVDQAAEYLRCKPQRIYDLVHAGQLTPSRDGRRLLFHRDELDRYLTSPQETAA